MKLTIFSFKNYEDYILLKKFYGNLGYDVVQIIVNDNGEPLCVAHMDEHVDFFKGMVNYCNQPLKIVCNNGDMTNYMLGWCEENSWEAEVIRVDDGKIKVSPMVEGCLTSWPYGWYITD